MERLTSEQCDDIVHRHRLYTPNSGQINVYTSKWLSHPDDIIYDNCRYDVDINYHNRMVYRAMYIPRSFL